MNAMKRLILAIVLFAGASVAFAVPASPVSAALPITPLWSGLLDNSGQPLAGGEVWFYKSGAAGPVSKTVWDTPTKMPAGAMTHVTLDAYGRANVYGDMVDGYRYKLVVYDASGPTELYEIDGLEVVSTIAPPSFHPGYLNTPKADIASLTVSGRASLANTTMNGAQISNATCTFMDISNSWLHYTALDNCGLNNDFDAATYTIFNLGPPTAPQDAARLIDVTTSEASTTAYFTTYANTAPMGLGQGWISNWNLASDVNPLSASGWTGIASGNTYLLIGTTSHTNSSARNVQYILSQKVYFYQSGTANAGCVLAKLTYTPASGTETICDQDMGFSGETVAGTSVGALTALISPSIALRLQGIASQTTALGETITVKLYLKASQPGFYYIPEVPLFTPAWSVKP